MEMNKYTGHILLKASATYDKIETLCAETKGCGFAGIRVNSYWVSVCAELLKGTNVKVYTVIGFPLGTMNTKAKAFETTAAIADGAKEIDMVLSIGGMKAGHYGTVRADIKAVVETAESSCVKVILENCPLTEGEVTKACKFCVKTDVAFVKTSTEFSAGGAIPEDVKLMKDTVKGRYPVKAARGAHYYEGMEKMMEAEVDRIGTSTDVKSMQKETSDGGY